MESFSATDCPLDDTCMDIHMSEKTPTSLGHHTVCDDKYIKDYIVGYTLDLSIIYALLYFCNTIAYTWL